jgi:hypothetical protein
VKVGSHLYYLSAFRDGPGFSGADIATWATDSIDRPTQMFSVDTLAKEFSDWGELAPNVGDRRGAQASRDCVGEALGGVLH